MKQWKFWAFKVFQVFGIGATVFIAFWLFTHPSYESRGWLRWFEIVASVIAAIGLSIDALDLSPEED